MFLKKKTKINKKTFILSSIAALTTFVPLGVGLSQVYINSKEVFHINGNTYNSFAAASNKLMQDATVNEYAKEISSKWKLTVNGENSYFNNATALRDAIYSKLLTSTNVNSPFSLEKKIDFGTGKLLLTDSEWAQIQSSSSSNLEKTIYKKNKNKITDNIDDAYMSYFNTKDAFYFDNIYFNSKQDLNSYLINQYLPNKENNYFKNFVIEAPNGVKSNPISTDPKKINESINYLKKFIGSNSQNIIEYTNSVNNQTVHLSKGNYLNQINKININDLNYQHVYSNEGESRYVVDNIYTDDNNLIGPYLYEGNIDIGSFTNIDMWRKTNNIKNNVYQQSKINITIGNFFSSITNDDNILTLKEAEMDGVQPNIFRTPLVTTDEKSVDEKFLNDLGVLNQQLKNEVIDANKRLLQGKKYNTFYKIPIMYNFIMSRIVSRNLSHDIISLVQNYFKKIVGFVQDCLEVAVLYNDQLLKDIDGNKINLVEFFNIGNSEYDINTTPEYFLQQFKKQFPKLTTAICVFNEAAANIFSTSGLIPFSAINNNYLFDFKLISAADYETISPFLKEIYETFSNVDFAPMLKGFINVAKRYNPEIQAIVSNSESEHEALLDKLLTNNKNISIGTVLKSIGLKNSMNYQKSESILISELQIYIQKGALVKGGYLEKLYKKASRVDDSYWRITALVNYEISKSPNLFRLYIALLADLEMKTNIFNEQIVSNPAALAAAISRISFGILGTAAGVGTVMKKFYSNKKLITPAQHPINSLVGKALPDGRIVEIDTIVRGNEDIVSDLIPGEDSRILTMGELKWLEKRKLLYRIDPDNKTFHKLITGTKLDKYTKEILLNTWKMKLSEYEKAIEEFRIISMNFTQEFASLDDYVTRPIQTAYEEHRYRSQIKKVADSSPSDPIMIYEPNKWAEQKNDKKFNLTKSIEGPGKTQKRKWASSSITSKASKKIKNIFKFIGDNIFEILGGAFAVAELAFVLFDLFKIEEIQDFYVYTTIDGTEFIWDGGKTVVKYFGFQSDVVNKLSPGDLLSPIQITLPQVEEFYYFNQTKYYDINELKIASLEKMFVDKKIDNENFKIKYTFDKQSGDESIMFSYDSIDSVIESVLNNIGFVKKADDSYEITNINNSKYITNISYAFSNGINTNANNLISVIANNIVENIRPTKIVKKVKVVDGNIVDLDNEFKLPGMVYKNGLIIDNTNEMQNYIVDNSANIMKENSNNIDLITQNDFKNPNRATAEKESLNNLYNSFKLSFTPQSLKTNNANWLNTNLFSELKNSRNSYTIYTVKSFGNVSSASFLSSYDAELYISKYINISKISETVKDKMYILSNGVVLYSENEFNKYVNSHKQ